MPACNSWRAGRPICASSSHGAASITQPELGDSARRFVPGGAALAERLEGASALLDRPLAVPQHVAVNEEAEARGFANPRDHALIAGAH
jgi:hypothetical protein